MKTRKLKKITRNILIILISIVSLPLIFIVTYFLFVPISAPEGMVRSYVFNEMLTATDWDDAHSRIEDNGWEIESESSEHGLLVYYDNDGSIDGAAFATDKAIEEYEDSVAMNENLNAKVVGVRSINVYLGNFDNPFEMLVYAKLAFDEDDKLIEVVALSYTISP